MTKKIVANMIRRLKKQPNKCPFCGEKAVWCRIGKGEAWRIRHGRGCYFRQPSNAPYTHLFFGSNDKSQRGWNWRQPHLYSSIWGTENFESKHIRKRDT